jgi:sialidase-1
MLLDEGSSFGYSCLTSIDENTIGILYEGSRAHMTFKSITLDELINIDFK